MARAPPSQFAALLRRSKFSSFDPEIAQVYTSHGGNVHRGNWGFKRPLALRRRNAYITVKTVDSNEQQTEWYRGEAQGRWIKMWDEVAVTPQLAPGPWRDQLGEYAEAKWEIDSEFASAPFPPRPRMLETEEGCILKDEGSTLEPNEDLATESEENMALESFDGSSVEESWKHESEAIPNVEAMSNSEFSRYLEKLRKLRPEFSKFVERAYKERRPNMGDEIPGSTLWRQSFFPRDDFKKFLRHKAGEFYSNPQTRVIEQQPQRVGGLTYSHVPLFQSLLLQKPRLGRVIQRSEPTRGNDYKVSFSGMITQLSKNLFDSKKTETINFQRLATTGVRTAGQGDVSLKVVVAKFHATPITVGQDPEGLEGVHMSVFVTDAARVGEAAGNPYPPGSREYVAHSERETKIRSPVLPPRAPWRAPEPVEPQQDGDQLLEALTGIVSRET
ncbi:hypothetical protein OBBRIDRAFT_789876 [Obba rivulosa]|uniref:Uncharacterized protein n=1 Tax=Obba rivulosa TaxID=1052685 RepID=A0A8E2DQF8_9APHY|nr:hypothetical protein OBBRIDRAFT_789876 [Obba rivulosa]